MDEIFRKLGGNWGSIKKDLGRDVDYEQALNRNPFIQSHLDPDLPSPRAGKPKDNWMLRPEFDFPKGPTPQGEPGGA